MLIDAPTLERPVDLQTFVEHFTDEPVTVFPNFGDNRTLIAHCPMDEFSNYSHRPAFVRTLLLEQYPRLLQRVSVTALHRLSEEPS